MSEKHNDLQFLYDNDKRIVASYDLTGVELIEKRWNGTLYDELGAEFGQLVGGHVYVMCNKCRGYTRYDELGKKGHNCPLKGK